MPGLRRSLAVQRNEAPAAPFAMTSHQVSLEAHHLVDAGSPDTHDRRSALPDPIRHGDGSSHRADIPCPAGQDRLRSNGGLGQPPCHPPARWTGADKLFRHGRCATGRDSLSSFWLRASRPTSHSPLVIHSADQVFGVKTASNENAERGAFAPFRSNRRPGSQFSRAGLSPWLIAMRLGLASSGTTRSSSMFSRPLTRLAPFTSMWSARLNDSLKLRWAMPWCR